MILVLIIGEFSSLSLSSIKETKDKNILLQINKLIIDSKELLDIARANSALDLILEQEVPLALSDNDMITLFITNSFITPQLITDNLDLWTMAIKKRSATGRGSSKKIELTGIKKLRELILELAVRGKLVPQDPNDVSVN